MLPSVRGAERMEKGALEKRPQTKQQMELLIL
jgi:hypothetical protein